MNDEISKNNEMGYMKNEKKKNNIDHFIITLNSSKLKTPSPFMSKCLIITIHSSMDFDSPSFFNIFLSPLGVMNPHPSSSYIPKACLKSFNFSSSSSSSINLIRSSKSNNPSPLESNASTATSAIFNNNFPPIWPNLWLNSEAEIFPSPSLSKYLTTRSYSSLLIISKYQLKHSLGFIVRTITRFFFCVCVHTYIYI
ncbi:hypothetical protein V6Z11_A03G072700 [Gossypium hirsutum]